MFVDKMKAGVAPILLRGLDWLDLKLKLNPAPAEPDFDSQITDEFPAVVPPPKWLFRTVGAGTDLLEELLDDGWEPIGSEVRQSAKSYKMSGAFDYWSIVHLRKLVTHP